MEKIVGFEINTYTTAGVLGRVYGYRIHYGASPIRDKKSMDAKLRELDRDGVDYTVHPIIRSKVG